ncbi:hypothetical protein GQX74_014670 [Glossina fuscipes]|nr:hypothetical protein GQX74_014670 [Glossina fuscipes]
MISVYDFPDRNDQDDDEASIDYDENPASTEYNFQLMEKQHELEKMRTEDSKHKKIPIGINGTKHSIWCMESEWCDQNLIAVFEAKGDAFEDSYSTPPRFGTVTVKDENFAHLKWQLGRNYLRLRCSILVDISLHAVVTKQQHSGPVLDATTRRLQSTTPLINKLAPSNDKIATTQPVYSCKFEDTCGKSKSSNAMTTLDGLEKYDTN